MTDSPSLRASEPSPDRPAGSGSRASESRLSKNPSESVNSQEPAQDEGALVEAARTDREAFGELYDRHFDAVYNYIARRLGGDEVLSEDIAAAVWERALTAIERYELRGVPFRAWLYRIAGNLIANHHRRQKLRRYVPFLPHHGRERPQQGWDDRAALQAALAELSESDQEVIGLYYFAGLKPPEIAESLGCSTAAVHKRLHRARERLKKQLDGDSGVT